jgi:hypothetical protein
MSWRGLERLTAKVQGEFVLALGLVVGVGEPVAGALPHGWVRTGAQAGLPILAGALGRLRSVPLAKVEQIIARLAARIPLPDRNQDQHYESDCAGSKQRGEQRPRDRARQRDSLQ